jgi:hypothetical protein
LLRYATPARFGTSQTLAAIVHILAGTGPDTQSGHLHKLTLAEVAVADPIGGREGSDMTLSNFRLTTLGIASAIAAASVLAGCGASAGAAGGVSTASSGNGGSSAPATIAGITTPKSVSVVTAN